MHPVFAGKSQKLFSAISFSQSFLFSLIFTTEMLYYLHIAGLNAMQMVLVGTANEIACLIFEIPTGVVADRYSRKLSIVLGYALMGAGFILCGSIPKFWVILIAQIIWGLGWTFISGSLEAWAADEIAKQDSLYLVKGAKCGSIGSAVGIVAAILAYRISILLPMILGGGLFVSLSLLVLVSMEEHPFKIEGEQKESPLQIFRNGMRLVKGRKILLMLFAAGIFLGLYSEGLDRLWTMYVLDTELFTRFAAYEAIFVGAVSVLVKLFSTFVMGALEKYLAGTHERFRICLMLAVGIMVIGLIGMSLVREGALILLLVVMINVARDTVGPLENTLINEAIPESAHRATILSARSQVDALGQIASGPVCGAVSMRIGVRAVFAFCGIILSPVLWIYGHAGLRH